MNLRSLNIAQRSALSFAVITVLTLVLGLFAYLQMSGLHSAEQDIETNWLPSIESSADMDIHLQSLRIDSLRTLATPPGAAQDEITQRMQSKRATLLKDVDHYRDTLISSEDEARQFDKVRSSVQAYINGLDKLVSLDNSSQDAQALDWANNGLRELANAVQDSLSELRDLNKRGAAQAGIFARDTYDRGVQIVVLVLVAVVALTTLFAWLLTRSIVTPINASLRAAESIAAGDLSQVIEADGNDEATRMMLALRKMQGSLRDTMQQIADSSTQLASAAEEMTAVTEESNRGLQTQNSEIEQAATAVTEMSAAVDEVARNAVMASESAQRSSQAARGGRQRVGETLTAIRELTSQVQQTSTEIEGLAVRSKDISKVLNVISGIAEQTNLLALNAAIEAARAGEQGRGFAVVADEVRALAHRTQTSTLEIEEMISAIQRGTEDAAVSMERSREKAVSTSRSADLAGQALEEITASVNLIEERNLQIATASEEQAHVAREVDQNLVRIRDLSIQSAAGANQTSAASNELSNLAVALNGLVLRFKL
ncbi:methyl-accepting chemotaxis protein [Pseudomonas matsuisoli]|uniref:Methyl-accepting chemotaxis protein n=2 Tax=Pseudomonas matsuisoli TaxID=1515666 RepID=A0A917PUB7_9PSED|nr:methyl-accepting chemotaxis protein [Pseudomonas matsuisoli]GGJ92620.1 methyl-accepting chemotaxis protein [Pseudomonas matsuisoli]